MYHLSFRQALLSLSLVCLVTVAPRARAIDAALIVGQTATLSVTVDGTAPFSYQWYKDGAMLPGATGESLVLAGVQLGNAGLYWAVVANDAGSTTSDSSALTVEPPVVAPVIVTQPLGQTVTLGSTVTFSAEATGSPAPSYQWWWNGAAIPGATGASHTLTNVGLDQAGGYSVVATNVAGAVTSQVASLNVIGFAAPLAVGADFNEDNWSDFLWQNTTTGECSVWLMNGTTKVGAAVLGTAPAGWQIVGTGDFNGNETTDILWRNQTTGANRVWLMAGTSVAGTKDLTAMVAPWVIGGTGDFNGDGRTDLVWYNPTTRETRLWLFDGVAFPQTVSLGIAGSGWQVVSAGDFNGDEQSDLVWVNTSTRAIQVQLMNGVQPGTIIKLGTGGTGWTVAGTSDLNDDGRSDILWQSTTGACSVWLINGTTVSARVNLPTVPAAQRLRN